MTDKIYNIAIIGAGQLGSRHLQGLKLADIGMNIYVVDIQEEPLRVAKERYDQVTENPKIQGFHLLKSVIQLPDAIDLVIIATNSVVRASLTKELLATKEVKNIVFEKVLFPALKEYVEIHELLIQYDVHAWVNCPRRMFDYYKELVKKTSGLGKIDFSIIGKDWGLGCNAIHFLDLFAMFTGEQEFSLDTSLLDNEIHSSKREGYIEFTGTIHGITPSGNSFSISSLKEYDLPTTISIKSDNLDIIIDESNNIMSIDGKQERVQTPFQSQLTGKLAEQILLEKKSDLASFHESAQIHLQFLSPMINFYNKLTGNNKDICPIT